mgnify:CR=1 FL=1
MPPHFRFITQADRAAVADICATVWDGNDYLPEAFDEWVAAPRGTAWFVGAEVDGRLAGLGRLVRFAPGEYWLEGMRVHPDFRRRGLAAALHAHLIEVWEQAREPGTLRLVTHCRNDAMLALCARTGFRRLGEFTFAAAAAEAGPHAFTPLAAADAAWAHELIARTELYAEQHGLCDQDWKWQALTPEFLAGRLAAGEGYRWRHDQGVLLAAVDLDDESDEPTLFLRFPAAAAQRTDFLRDTRALAAALGRRQVRWALPARADLLAELLQAGFRRSWADTEVCFERQR